MSERKVIRAGLLRGAVRIYPHLEPSKKRPLFRVALAQSGVGDLEWAIWWLSGSNGKYTWRGFRLEMMRRRLRALEGGNWEPAIVWGERHDP